VPGLGTSFGRGAATTAQQDLLNADAILIMGSSMAENHPVGFRFVVEARERGARVIHIDPRFNRTSAMADTWVPLRAGSDIVFLGALVRHVLENGLEFRDYVVSYTNAPVILREDLKDAEDLGGVFSGYDPTQRSYESESWLYEGAARHGTSEQPARGGHAKDRGGEAADLGTFERDPTLEHPRCVFQALKRHFQRYTPEMVERVCGVPRARFLEVADAFCSASGREKTGVICYSVGWTQHSVGVQIIRTAAILQLLLGNMGRPGGGILALRGHASIQGSTDIPTLYDILPGYLPMPTFAVDGVSLDRYAETHRTRTGWWANLPKYIVSLLKAWYGDAARADDQFGFGFLPRTTGDHSHLGYWQEMAEGKIEGLFVMGQNPAIGGPHARMERKALARLKWLVVRDLVEIETATFWRDSPEVARGELVPEEVETEVFFFPSAGHAEKEGTFTNTQRLLQWREKAVDPPGDARSEAWFMYHLGRRLKDMASKHGAQARDAGLLALTWDYETEGPRAEPSTTQVLQEINGYRVADRRLVESYTALADDGSTACGCWIYSGVFPSPDRNRANERNASGRYGHGWGFAWPSDRRILYNRASADPEGRPWSERKKLVWWDAEKRTWTGLDVPDFAERKDPTYPGDPQREGDDALPGDAPFTMHQDGLGWLWVPSGLKDGPLPTHYEPLESPVENLLYPEHRRNPAVKNIDRADNPHAEAGDPRFPFVLTTHRLTEHHTAGGMSRHLSHLAELQPELFCEVSPEMAGEVGLLHGGWATITTPRGIVEARVLVTPRMRPLTVDGRTVHQVGLPYHWGWNGLATGDAANDLLVLSEEPNVRIMESKALLCRVEPGRRPHGPADLQRIGGAAAVAHERS
jgi:formate dehydrogenase major subunit